MSPYVKSVIGDFLDVKILSKSAAVWQRYVSGVMVGKGIFWGGVHCISISYTPVPGIEFLKHL